MLKAIPFVVVLAAAGFAQSAANDEMQVWNLEKAYWEYAGPGVRVIPAFLPM